MSTAVSDLSCSPAKLHAYGWDPLIPHVCWCLVELVEIPSARESKNLGLNHIAVKVLTPDRKSTRLNSSHSGESRMPSSA